MKRTTIHQITGASTGERFAFSVTCDVTPAPGTVTADIGHGVTVVRRDPPRRPGEWVAPFAANCAKHGWIASRRTCVEASSEGREHILTGEP